MGIEVAPDAWRRRASTTRRTMTTSVSLVESEIDMRGGSKHRSVQNNQQESHTCKRLLNIDHLSRTGLHKAAIPPPRPLESLSTRDHACVFQIALVARNDFDRLHFLGVVPMFALHVDHLNEFIKRREGRVIGDVVNEEKRIGPKIRRGPETAVFFLAGGVGKGEKVGLAVDGAGDGVGIL